MRSIRGECKVAETLVLGFGKVLCMLSRSAVLCRVWGFVLYLHKQFEGLGLWYFSAAIYQAINFEHISLKLAPETRRLRLPQSFS